MIKVKICHLVEKHHRKSQRAYAHWGHIPNTICVSKEIYTLPTQVSLALLLHELGHALISGGYEEEANKAAQEISGIKIKYASETPWGKRLQYIYFNEVPQTKKVLKKFISPTSLKPFLR